MFDKKKKNQDEEVGEVKTPVPGRVVNEPLGGLEDRRPDHSQDDQEDLETPSKAEQEKEGKKHSKSGNVTFQTTREVTFVVNGEEFKGSEFSVAKEVVEDRKKLLVERYGAGILVD